MIESVVIDGTSYKKVTYNHELPATSKRNTLLLRLGGNGIVYNGNTYITNVRFDNTEIDIPNLNTTVFESSYGDGLSNLHTGTFNGTGFMENSCKHQRTENRRILDREPV